MEFDELRDLIDSTPEPTGPELDAKARAWLAKFGFELESGDGDPVVLVVFAIDEDIDFKAYALPGNLLTAAAHRDLAALHRAGFEHFFTADLRPDQYAGAFRICGGTTEEPDVFADQIEELREEVEEAGITLDYDALLAKAGGWNEYRITSGAKLSGSISHVYSANLGM